MMREEYRSELEAHVFIDGADRVRSIQHSQRYWEGSAGGGGLPTAIAYLEHFADIYGIGGKLDHLATKVDFLEPRDQSDEYRLGERRRQFDAETVGFYQTYLNVPVWRAGLRVTIKNGPHRVVRSEDTSQSGVSARLPSEEIVDRYRRVLADANRRSLQRRATAANPGLASASDASLRERDAETGSGDAAGAKLLRGLLRFRAKARVSTKSLRLIRGRFWIYKYDAERRHATEAGSRPPVDGDKSGTARDGSHAGHGEFHSHPGPLPFQLAAVPGSIVDGQYYLVAEMTFEVTAGSHKQVWRILVELETGAVLLLSPMSASSNGLVYEADPITQSGTTAPNSAANNATLDPFRNDVTLQNLDPPSGGTQALAGSFARVTQVVGPDITPPTQPDGVDFDYHVRTDDFSSVSGYFHVDRVFRTLEDLGFDIPTYMANTVFPVSVDIRESLDINAHCVGDGMGGIEYVGFGLGDVTDTANPLGRACDPRVHLHEVLGHGILYEAVDDANFGFAHSAGDSLSLIYFDHDSNCWGVDGTPVGKPGDLRFTYVPWHPFGDRRCDRNVAQGWAWNGSKDDARSTADRYGAEEILETTLFRFYRSIGGDSADAGRRRFASRMAMYLIIRAIGDLTPATNPAYARDFAEALMATDAFNWTSEGVFGGAYRKVIRWTFEKQGEYQSPLVTGGGPGDGTITTPGKPPLVDVYIDDGRAGEYPFQPVHWNTTTMWNRRSPDAIDAHQEPALGETNYAYVKIKNRGTQKALNVVVHGYHTKPGAGLNWPADFEGFATPSLNAGTLNPNSSEEKIVGPFEWTPNLNSYGHDCMLMAVTADGDAANTDNFTAGETIPEWRLVPNDNNIGQRNVHPVPGGGGGEGLMSGLDGKSFFVGNPNPKRSRIGFRVALPALLARAGWRLKLVDASDGFVLKSGGKREVVIRLRPGKTFTRKAVAAATDRDIRIEVLADDNVIGGMTYRLDPELAKPWNTGRRAMPRVAARKPKSSRQAAASSKR